MTATRTLTLALLSFAGMVLAGVLMALFAPQINPADGFVLWPLVLSIMGVTLLLFVGRAFILPEVLVRDAFTSFLAIIGLVTVSHLIAFATTVSLYLTLQVPMPWVLVIWFLLLWSGVAIMHRSFRVL